MSIGEGLSTTTDHRIARRAGAFVLVLGLASGCGSSPGRASYIDCKTQPGEKVSTMFDMSKTSDQVTLGDKTKHTYQDKNTAGTVINVEYDDTYHIGVEKTEQGNMVIAGGTGSPVGFHTTLAELNATPDHRHIFTSSEPGKGRNDPPYFTLAATATGGSMIEVDFTCSTIQTAPK